MMDGEEFFKNVDRPGASEDGVLCSRKSSAAEKFSYSSARPVGLQWPMEKRQCFLLEFKRTPEEFRQCHTNEPALAACRRCLEKAGYNTQLHTKAKVFVAPDLWPPVLDFLRRGASLCRPDDLQFRHVITDEKHRFLVFSCLSALSNHLNIKVKREESFFVDVPGKLALVSLQPMPIDPWETVPQPQAWNTLEIDFQPGSPAEIQWCEAPEL